MLELIDSAHDAWQRGVITKEVKEELIAAASRG